MSRAAACLIVLVTLTVTVAQAHHSVLGFDSAHAVTLRGVVTEVLWNNPHTYIVVMARPSTNQGPGSGGAKPAPAKWVIESESPVALRRLGWTRESVRAGDAVVATGAADRRGRAILRCQSVTVAGRAPLPCYPAATQ
jgi:hypothetical protein